MAPISVLALTKSSGGLAVAGVARTAGRVSTSAVAWPKRPPLRLVSPLEIDGADAPRYERDASVIP